MEKQKRFLIKSQVVLGVEAKNSKEALTKAKEMLKKFNESISNSEVVDIKWQNSIVIKLPF